ncbi:MAG: hypothetical protein IKT00_06200 [Prevotella sp.]|nr:hypothetical protein [Prevotella sp.]
MNPNEMNPNMGPVNSNPVNNPMDEQPQEGGSNTWKYVTIGGAAALLVGAGTVYATDAFGARTAIFGGDDAAAPATATPATGAEAAAAEVKAETTETTDDAEAAKTTESAEPAADAATADTGIAVEIYDHAPVAHVGQHLSFADAFAAARAQVGPGGVFHWHGHDYGTYYETEWDAMSDAQQAQYEASAASPAHATHPVTPHFVAEAPVAVVSDGMSFADAFAAARAQVGAGGVFEWHGGVFSTYYENEWDGMTPQQQHHFTAHVHTQHVPQYTEYYADADGGVHFKSVETFGTEEYDQVTAKVLDDDDSGVLTSVQEVEGHVDEMHIDVASDGQTAFVDVENDGIVDMTFTPIDADEPNPFDGAPLTDDGSMIL